ncbi:reverse transcriptase domain-containing protein [Tanacetum coccineum]
MTNNVKTYDGTGDPEDHVKIFQAAAQVERQAMPIWCHMFNLTLIGAARVWFDELHPESIDGYKDLKAAFLAYFMQQKKYVKDPIKIHNIKQRDGETIEEFMEQFKVETGSKKGAPECMRIFGFMHGVNNPELTKHLNEHVPKTMEEIMIATIAFIRGEAAAAGKKKGHASWRAQDQSKRNASERRSDFLGKFKLPPPTLKKQIKELVQAGKLSHLIKEIKQGRDQPKVGKKEVLAKEKSIAIYMIQPWHRMTRQKVTQSFERVSEFTFPSLTTSSGTEGLLVIEAEISGHMIHCMYVDGGSSTEVLYEHCFNQLRPEIKNQMVPSTTSLTSFSRETIWPLGQLRLLVTIGDAVHSTKAWMNFMMVRSLSPYNGIIRRPEIREIQAVPSTAHGMLKFPVDGGIVTIRSTILILAECATMISSKEIPKEAGVRYENFKVALHLNFPDQEPSDMTGVPRSIAEHRLNIREGYSTIRQNKRGQALKRAKAIQTEMLTKAITGYHMAESDEEKTAFHTSHGVYCYTKMPFRLKNAGVTYQRLVDKAFDNQVGRNIDVYIDDLLNPKKSTFGAVEGMFLGYMISSEGIKPCPDKTEAVLQLPSPWTIKEILENFLIEKPDESPPDTLVVETLQEPWTLFMDGSSCVDGSGTGLILTSPEGTDKNKKADALSKIASTNFAHLSKQVLVEILKEKFIQEKEVTTVVEEDGITWMTPIIEYLTEGTLLEDKKEASKLLKHPQSNGLVERANARSIGDRTLFKARLGKGNKNWIEELPHVLWAHRTTIKSSHGDTPFSLTYGTEAVIPAEIGMPTYRTTAVDAVHNDEELRLNLELFTRRTHVNRQQILSKKMQAMLCRWEAWTKFGKDRYEVTKALETRSIQTKVYERHGPSADVEHSQSQEMLSLGYGMDKFGV